MSQIWPVSHKLHQSIGWIDRRYRRKRTYMVNWAQVTEMTQKLSQQIVDSGYSVNYVIAVARGGFVPARLLSGLLGVKRLGSVGIAYDGPERSSRMVYGCSTPISREDRIILVEDALESGRSLDEARQLLVRDTEFVRTVCYFYRPTSVVKPDFSLGAQNRIPVFPWELN
jgi:hypoxanthine phosphoribosyltransferase